MSPTQPVPPATLSDTDLATLIDALSRCADLDEAMVPIDSVLRRMDPDAVVSVNLNATTAQDPADEIQLQRIWTSHPAEYPVTGRKCKRLTPWTETLFVQCQVFVGEGRAMLAQTFDDHALMARLGLNAFINVPVLLEGRTIGTFNVFGPRPAWREGEVAVVRLLAMLAARWITPHPALADRFTAAPVRVALSPVPARPLAEGACEIGRADGEGGLVIASDPIRQAPVTHLHHYTLRCASSELEPLRDFYTRHLGLTVGPRPHLPAPGFWLYLGGRPVIHLYAIAAEPTPFLQGPLDHVALLAHDLEGTRSYLLAQGVPFEEAPVPDWPIHQIFLRDPLGLKVELSFELGEQ